VENKTSLCHPSATCKKAPPKLIGGATRPI